MLESVAAQCSFLTNPQKALEQYLKLGFHIEENIFSPEECARFIEAAADLPNAKQNTFRPQMMPHRENPLFLEAMRKPEVVEIMAMLLGGTPAGLQTEFFYCKPGTRGFSLHQDNFFVQAPFGAFASAWVALTDTYKDKGGLIVYPGSHQEGLLPVRPLHLATDTGQDPNANNEETVVPEKYQAINAHVPKGAVLFIHGHIVHGSNPNITDEWRYVLLSTYVRKGEKFRPGNYAQREEIEL